MIDSLHVEIGLQKLPVRALVGRNDGAGGGLLPDEVDTLGLAQKGPCDGSAAASTQHDHHAAFAAAVAEQPPIDTLLPQVGGPDMTTKGSSVHLHLARQAHIPDLGRHRLAEFVHQHERRLVLHVQIARELDGRQPLGRVHEQADRAEQVDEGQLPRREDGAGGHAELTMAGCTFETPTGRQVVDISASAGQTGAPSVSGQRSRQNRR